MGTTYNVVIISNNPEIREKAQNIINDTIKRIDSHLSNWNPDSEISKFNKSKESHPFNISPMLLDVMVIGNQVHEESNGFFDVTLAPIINLWGFGAKNGDKTIPTKEEISTKLSQIGQNRQLDLDVESSSLTKLNSNVTISLSAIAKGYGIDQIAKGLTSLGIDNFLVEIGGDLITRGKNPHGLAWQIGIEQPDHSGKEIQKLVKLNNIAMATSGDYRNYFEEDGVRYSHIINPKNGYPITHNTASVTVLAENATLADAWATALLAIGEKQGMKLAEQNMIAALFIVNQKDNSGQKYITKTSSAFQNSK
ncbi:MAG: FAD:protein FMN transferase [Alphaproteobacteria bacterium]